MKVVIWGHPLHSHTHSYVHEAYYRAFNFMQHEVYWFHDDDFPEDFDYENCVFITEGFADKKIPLRKTSVYFVMYCPSPKKYLEAEVKKYVDMRMIAVNHSDHIQSYSFDKEKAEKLGPCYYFVGAQPQKISIKNDYVDYEIDDFDKVYFAWATNLLPNEIIGEFAFTERKSEIYFFGTLSNVGEGENISNFIPFISAANRLGIPFRHNDPWRNPLQSDELIRLTRQSLLGIDIRGKKHIDTEVITCRVFKNVSYGHLGLTNSKAIYEAMEGNCLYNSDTEQLLYDGLRNSHDFSFILNAMNYVKHNHTYVNRITSMLSIL